MGKMRGSVEEHTAALFSSPRAANRVNEFIHTRWALLDLCATVFLIYADKQGNVGSEIIDALREIVRERLLPAQWPKSNRSTSPADFRRQLPDDVFAIWRKHSPPADLNDREVQH